MLGVDNVCTFSGFQKVLEFFFLVFGKIFILFWFSGSPTGLSLHKSGSVVAVSMDSGSVRLYDIKAKKLQQHYVLHDSTTSVCWHPTANYLLTSGKDGKVIVVDVMEGRPLYTLQGHNGAVTYVQFNTDGEYFASGGIDQHIMVWKANLVK